MKRLTQAELNEMLDNLETDFSNMILDGLSFEERKDLISDMICEEVEDDEDFEYDGFDFQGSIFQNMVLDLSLLDESEFQNATIQECILKDDGHCTCTFDNSTLRNVQFILADKHPDTQASQADFEAETTKDLLVEWVSEPEFENFGYVSFVDATIENSSFDKGVNEYNFTGATITDTSFTNSYYHNMDLKNTSLSNVSIKDCEFYTKFGKWGEEPSMNCDGITFEQVTVENVTLTDFHTERTVDVNSIEELIEAAKQEKAYSIEMFEKGDLTLTEDDLAFANEQDDDLSL